MGGASQEVPLFLCYFNSNYYICSAPKQLTINGCYNHKNELLIKINP